MASESSEAGHVLDDLEERPNKRARYAASRLPRPPVEPPDLPIREDDWRGHNNLLEAPGVYGPSESEGSDGEEEGGLLQHVRGELLAAGEPARPPPAGEPEDELQECWMCIYGVEEEGRIVEKHVREMNRLFGLHVLCTSPEALANMLHGYYVKNVYEPMRQQHLRPMPWSRRMALEHVTEHVEDPRIELVQMRRLVRDAIRLLTSSVAVDTEDGPSYRPDDMNRLQHLIQLQHRLLTTDSTKLVGGNPSVSVRNECAELVRHSSIKVQRPGQGF